MSREKKSSGLLKVLGVSVPIVLGLGIAKAQNNPEVVLPIPTDTTQTQVDTSVVAPMGPNLLQNIIEPIDPTQTQMPEGAYFEAGGNIFENMYTPNGVLTWHRRLEGESEFKVTTLPDVYLLKQWREDGKKVKGMEALVQEPTDTVTAPIDTSKIVLPAIKDTTKIAPKDTLVAKPDTTIAQLDTSQTYQAPVQQDTSKALSIPLYNISSVKQKDTINVRLLDVRKDSAAVRTYLGIDGFLDQENLLKYVQKNPTDKKSLRLLNKALRKKSLDDVMRDLNKGEMRRIRDNIYLVYQPGTDTPALLHIQREEKRPVATDFESYLAGKDIRLRGVVKPAREIKRERGLRVIVGGYGGSNLWSNVPGSKGLYGVDVGLQAGSVASILSLGTAGDENVLNEKTPTSPDGVYGILKKDKVDFYNIGLTFEAHKGPFFTGGGFNCWHDSIEVVEDQMKDGQVIKPHGYKMPGEEFSWEGYFGIRTFPTRKFGLDGYIGGDTKKGFFSGIRAHYRLDKRSKGNGK